MSRDLTHSIRMVSSLIRKRQCGPNFHLYDSNVLRFDKNLYGLKLNSQYLYDFNIESQISIKSKISFVSVYMFSCLVHKYSNGSRFDSQVFIWSLTDIHMVPTSIYKYSGVTRFGSQILK